MDANSLWTRFHGELYAFLRSRVDSDDAAQDLLQSAFLRAHQRLVAGDVPTHPRAWLYQIVKNLIVDAHRRASRQRHLAAAADDGQQATTGTDEGEAFAVVARSLPMFIERLEPIYRDTLQMTELEGLTHVEAAARAGISLSGMKSRVRRGRKLVFKSLQRCCEFQLDSRGHLITCTDRTSQQECCSESDVPGALGRT